MKHKKIVELIEEAKQEAHLCNSSAEVFEWIDWFEKKLTRLI